MRGWVATFALLRLAAAVAHGQADSVDFRLGAGDRLRVTVFGHEDLSGEFTVSDTGAASLPLVGGLALGGLTVREAEQTILDALKPDYLLNPRVGVEVLNYRPFYILGEVNSPGSYPYVTGMTVNEAVAIGGGFTHRAKKTQMVVIRASDATKSEHPVSVTDAVLPGDLIRVLERFF
ncbi:MAG: polysaccharide export protein [Gammaproteobacteria bacterium]|nr:polysaccharide export protein [Gammaproteobacteria bacterium]